MACQGSIYHLRIFGALGARYKRNGSQILNAYRRFVRKAVTWRDHNTDPLCLEISGRELIGRLVCKNDTEVDLRSTNGFENQRSRLGRNANTKLWKLSDEVAQYSR